MYLTHPIDLLHVIGLLLESELFTFHYERMVALIMQDAQEVTAPHEAYMLYYIVLFYGQRHPSLFRSHRRWRKLLPSLGDVLARDVNEVSRSLLQLG